MNRTCRCPHEAASRWWGEEFPARTCIDPVMDRANFQRDSWSLMSEETSVMKFAADFCPFDPASPAQQSQPPGRRTGLPDLKSDQVVMTSTSPRLSSICNRTRLARRSRNRSTQASPTLRSLIQISGIASGR